MNMNPIVQICMTWALVCLETVEQRPSVMREIETWLERLLKTNQSYKHYG